jgi:hypothetical protein
MERLGIEFVKGYQTLAWLSTQNISHDDLENVSLEIDKSSLTGFEQTPLIGMFCGFCFGKFDLVMDFWCESGKVASHFVSKVSDKIRERKIDATFSALLCKKIRHEKTSITTYEDDIQLSQFPIRSYIYLRPSNSLEEVCESFEQFLSRHSNLSPRPELLWNDSAYPLIMIIDGDSAAEVVKYSIDIREHLGETLAESSTFLALRFGGKDKNCGKLLVLTFVKQRKFPSQINIPFSIERFASQKKDTVLECLGWYDYAVTHAAKSLYEVENRIFLLREKNPGQIYQTSTLLLRAIPTKTKSVHTRG